MYILKKWNGKYGKDAKFIVFDKKAHKYTLFSLDNPNDLAWVDNNLAENKEYANWSSFEDEPVDSLDDIIM